MLILLTLLTLIPMQDASPPVRQPPEVIEAYRVCEQFNTMMAQDFDFHRAFEATFTRNAARRRAIAISEGEFGDLDLAKVDDASLIAAYKAHMQILYRAFALIGVKNKAEEALFFPREIYAILKRKPPASAEDFPAYALQLEHDAVTMRTHVEQLAAKYPPVAEALQLLKLAQSKENSPPNHIVRPLTAYSRGQVLGVNEEYYRIGACAVIREGKEMKIVGIRFMDRLF